MKKIFTLFAAVLMAGSMMAEDGWIKFSEPQPATEVAGSTYGSDGFTLVIPTESDKASVDANNCTFGESAEETVTFTHRLKTGGASSKDGRIFTLNIPEEGPLMIYARTSSKDATDRSFLIANGADTIVYHICLDTDVVEGTSIFLPVFVENVPAGSYTITYNNGINFYGFHLGYDEPTALDFTISYADGVVTATPNDNTVGYIMIVRDASFDAAISTSSLTDTDFYDFAIDGVFCKDDIKTGESEFDIIDNFYCIAGIDELVPGDYKAIIAPCVAYGALGAIRDGDIIVKNFTVVATPTALENTAAGVKATKLVDNGHVVILRDGKKFNLVGAKL